MECDDSGVLTVLPEIPCSGYPSFRDVNCHGATGAYGADISGATSHTSMLTVFWNNGTRNADSPLPCWVGLAVNRLADSHFNLGIFKRMRKQASARRPETALKV